MSKFSGSNRAARSVPTRRTFSPHLLATGTAAPDVPASRGYLSALAVATLCVAALLRFYSLPTLPRGIQVDEAMNGSNVLQILETGRLQVFYPENMGREGLFINLQAACSYVLGNEPWVLRALSATFGVLTVWTVFLLVSELFSPVTGLFASFFLATSLWHLMLSRLGTRAVSAPFFLTLSVFLLFRAFRRLCRCEPFLGRMLTAGAVYGLGFHTYTAFRVSPLLIAALLVYFFREARHVARLREFRRGCAAFACAALVVVSPLVLYFIRHPAAAAGRASQILVFSRAANPALEILSNIWETAQMFFLVGDHNWRHNYDSERELFWPVAILFALGAGVVVVSIVKAIRARRVEGDAFPCAMLLLWLAVGAIPAVLSGEGVPHALRSVLMLPAVVAVAGIGAHRAWGYAARIVPNGAWRAAILLPLVLFIAWHPYHTYFDLWVNHPEVPGHYSMPLVDLAGQFNRMPKNMTRYIAVTATGPAANGIPVLLMPFTYLTRSYTEKQQEEARIRYITPQTFRPPAGLDLAGKNFCQAVQSALPGVPVTCIHLAY